MKNTYKLLILLLCTTLYVSCENNSETSEPYLEIASDVSFKATMMTRATDIAFEAGDEISVTAYNTDGSTYAENVSYTYSNALFSSSSPIKYTNLEQELAYRAIYPYITMDDNKSATFAVKSDQDSDSNYTLSDLMASYTATTSNTTPQLDFYHLLSKFVINITYSDVEMINVVASVNAATTVEYNFGTLTAVTQNTTENITMATNGVNSYKVIFAPQTISSDVPFGSININGTSYEFGYTIDIEMKAGKEYSIDAMIIDGDITFDNPIINNWDKGEYPEIDDSVVIPDGYTAIYTAEQLASIGVDGNYPLDGCYILANDLDLSNYDSWTPIGANGIAKFSGVFDGNNKTISYLTIDSDANYVGLFGYVDSGSISNLTLLTPQVIGGNFVGALCGGSYSTSSIENCGVEGGSVSSYPEYVSDYSYVGGICGYSSSTITTSCYNTSAVCGDAGSYRAYTGGLVGYTTSSTITLCNNAGNVSGESDGNLAYTGGLCGDISSSTLASCYNTGNVSGTTGSYISRTGGLCAYVTTSTITSCYNAGDISGNSSSTAMVGGLVGYSNSPIVSCYNSGDISGTSHSYAVNVGGVCGVNFSTIASCYNTGYVSGISNGADTDNDTLYSAVGGIVGLNTLNSNSISYCYSVGDVSCYSTYYDKYLGGVAGYNPYSTTITSSYYLPYDTTTYAKIYDGTADSNLTSTMTATSFVSTLNTAAGETHWEYDSSNVNSGYPTLLSIDYN